MLLLLLVCVHGSMALSLAAASRRKWPQGRQVETNTLRYSMPCITRLAVLKRVPVFQDLPCFKHQVCFYGEYL